AAGFSAISSRPTTCPNRSSTSSMEPRWTGTLLGPRVAAADWGAVVLFAVRTTSALAGLAPSVAALAWASSSSSDWPSLGNETAESGAHALDIRSATLAELTTAQLVLGRLTWLSSRSREVRVDGMLIALSCGSWAETFRR